MTNDYDQTAALALIVLAGAGTFLVLRIAVHWIASARTYWAVKRTVKTFKRARRIR